MSNDELADRLFKEIAYHLFMGEIEDDRKVIQSLVKLKAQGKYNNPLFDERKEYERLDEDELKLIDEALAKGIFLRPHFKIVIEDKNKEDDQDD